MALKFFSPKEAEILEILIARMVGIDQPDVFKRSPTSEGQSIDYAPTVIIDDFVAKLPEGLRGQLRQALHLFQWCPMIFIGKPRLFTRLSPQSAEAYIRTWAESRFGLRRRIFRGLRDLTFLGYYSHVEGEGDDHSWL